MEARAKVPEKKNLETLMEGFKRIYYALRMAQNNHHGFKSDFLEGKETFTAMQLHLNVVEHVDERPNSRTAQALKLAKKYYGKCNIENIELINEITNIAADNTRFLGFKVGMYMRRPQYKKTDVQYGRLETTACQDGQTYGEWINFALTSPLHELFIKENERKIR